MNATCLLFGHDDLLVRSELRLRCQRCGRLTSGVQIGAPRLDVRYAEPDPQHVQLRRVACAEGGQCVGPTRLKQWHYEDAVADALMRSGGSPFDLVGTLRKVKG